MQQTTLMRGIAIIMVYLQHTMGALGTNIFTPLGGGGVCIFLILSGYGLSESFRIKGLSGFWKKKIKGVLLAWCIIFTLSEFIEGNFFKIGILRWIGELTLINTTCWYLQYLFVWYILFYVCHYFLFLQKRHWLVYIIAAIVMFVFWHNIQAEQSLAFMLGILLSEKKEYFSMLKGKRKYLFLLCFFSLAFISLALKQVPFVRGCGEQSLLMKFCQLGLKTGIGCFVVMCLPMYNSFLHFTGKISYEIYLVHSFLLPKLFKHIYVTEQMVYITLFLFLTYLFSFALFKVNTMIKESC